MKLFKRIEFGNPILRAKAKKVSPDFLKTKACTELLRDMFYTMKRAHGVGLAAPQIGKSIQLAVIQVSPTKLRPNLKALPKTVVVNPVVVAHSKSQTQDWEGCLSCMSIRGKVPRHDSIKVEYTDERGKKITRQFNGFLARVFQHEIDHLNGIVYVDRMTDMKTLMTLGEFKKRILKSK